MQPSCTELRSPPLCSQPVDIQLQSSVKGMQGSHGMGSSLLVQESS